MKVWELIDQLAKYNQNCELEIRLDSELTVDIEHEDAETETIDGITLDEPLDFDSIEEIPDADDNEIEKAILHLTY